MHKWIKGLAMLAAGLAAFPLSSAQADWPSKPVRAIVKAAGIKER